MLVFFIGMYERKKKVIWITFRIIFYDHDDIKMKYFSKHTQCKF